MAGNLVSLISCQGKGRGPRQPEARPDTGNVKPTSLRRIW